MNLGLILYLIGVLDRLFLPTLIIFVLLVVFYASYAFCELNIADPVSVLVHKYKNKILFGIVISTIILIAVPSKTDMYTILMASEVGTVEQDVDKVKNTVDYIFEKIKVGGYVDEAN